MVEAAVARDPVEPGANVDAALVAEDRVEGGGEDLLQDVLGVLGRAEHVAAERVEARLVALHERFEGVRVAAARERDQALVALESEEGRAPRQHGQARHMLECARFQGI